MGPCRITKYLLRGLIALELCIGSQAFAQDPTYGLELSFSNQWLMTAKYDDEFTVDTGESETYRDLFKRRLEKICPPPTCIITTQIDAKKTKFFRVNVEGKWWFEITQDPSVIEIKVKPMTYTQMQALAPDMQRLIFEVAKSAQLHSRVDVGGGHIHIGYKSAFANPLHFRNFMVDFANHPELATGAWTEDWTNAPPLAALPKSRRERFATLLRMFDRGELGPIELARAINEQVYTGRAVDGGGGSEPKYHAFNLTRVGDRSLPEEQWTTEIRSIPAQTSMTRTLLDVGLLEARIRHIREIAEPIPFLDKEVPTRQTMINNFFKYVTEAGLAWSRYRAFMPKAWIETLPNCAAAKAYFDKRSMQ